MHQLGGGESLLDEVECICFEQQTLLSLNKQLRISERKPQI